MPSWILIVLVACSGTGSKSESGGGDSSIATDDTGGGGGSGDKWLPAGTGFGWFVDGTTDNSVFHLEMAQTRPPKDGEAYYGWISKSGQDPIALGEIPVTGEDLIFEADLGADAVLGGYDTFEAYATDNGGASAD